MQKFIDQLVFDRYVAEGWLSCNKHPELPLSIYNYTPATQFENKWDEVTSIARGLIVETATGMIVGKPFPKFFNIEQNLHTPTEDFEIFDKVDGSLLVLCLYNEELVFATRGSFVSDQANKAAEIFLLHYKDADRRKLDHFLESGYTLLFEIIYPENRIVVDYHGEHKLVLLGSYDFEGNEVSHANLPDWPHKVAKLASNLGYEHLQKLNAPNSEGFVVRFSNGERCKIKFADYVRLHRIMTNCSTTAIFDCLSGGHDLNKYLADVPDEFYDKVKVYIDELRNQYDNIDKDATLMYNAISNISNRKKYAEEAKTTPYADILFKMRDEKPYADLIWKRIRPEFRKI